MRLYRKKPVTVEAWQYTDTDALFTIAEWIRANGGSCTSPGAVELRMEDAFRIKTLEGAMEVSPGDYVIRGIQGEFYPRKPDIFAATYEAVL